MNALKPPKEIRCKKCTPFHSLSAEAVLPVEPWGQLTFIVEAGELSVDELLREGLPFMAGGLL